MKTLLQLVLGNACAFCVATASSVAGVQTELIHLGSHVLAGGESVSVPYELSGEPGDIVGFEISMHFAPIGASWASDLEFSFDGLSLVLGGYPGPPPGGIEWDFQGSVSASPGFYHHASSAGIWLKSPMSRSALGSFSLTNTWGPSAPSAWNDVTLTLYVDDGESKGPPIVLTRADAAAILLGPTSGVPIEVGESVVWSPFVDYGFGSSYEGLLPVGSLIEPKVVDAPPFTGSVLSISSPSYLFWIDDVLGGSFAHPARFVLIDATNPWPTVDNGGIQVSAQGWWPVVTVAGQRFEYFRNSQDRVSASEASPWNLEGLIAGAVPGPDDFVDVEQCAADGGTAADAEPSRQWAIVIRSNVPETPEQPHTGDKSFLADVVRFQEDLNCVYGIPDGNIVVKGKIDEAGAAKADFAAAIAELDTKIAASEESPEHIFVRITSHGNSERIQVRDGALSKAELATQLRKLSTHGAPVHLLLNSCRSGSMIDAHLWDFPAGSTILTTTDELGIACGYTWKQSDGTKFSGDIYVYAHSQALRSMLEGSATTDTNGDGFIDEIEAHDFIHVVHPFYHVVSDIYRAPSAANPQKRIVGVAPGGLNMLLRNNTGAAKTGFRIIFQGEVTGGAPHAWRSTEDDVLGEPWAAAGETVTYDAVKDQTTVSWHDPADPVEAGAYIHVGYAKKGLKPIRQYWTPTASFADDEVSSTDLVPTVEPSSVPTHDGSSLQVRFTSRSGEAGGTDASAEATLLYRVLEAPVSLDALSLSELDALAPAHFLGEGPVIPDEEQIFSLSIPGEILPGQILVVEAHLAWGISQNTSMQLFQFAETSFEREPTCPADLNGDGIVDGSDLAIVLGSWGPCDGCVADLNDDGVVDGSDLAIVLGGWGDCPDMSS